MEVMNLKITLTEPMLGTVPKNKDIYTDFVHDKFTDKEKLAEEVVCIEEEEEKGWTGFHQDEKGLFVFDYLFRGFMRNAANVLKDEVRVKNLKSKFTDYIFVGPRRIYLGKKEPDGVLERPLRAMTMQGPRVSLAKSDFVKEGTSFDVTLKILAHKELTIDIVKMILDYGQFAGLGQWRNASYGRFSYEVIG